MPQSERILMESGQITNQASISVIVPVYGRVEANLEELVDQCIDSLGASLNAILLVDDGSDGDNWEVISQLARQHEAVSGIRLGRNYGQHNAIWAGMQFVDSDFIVTVDADLQHPPHEILSLLNTLINRNLDVVYGVPAESQHSLSRRVTSKIFRWILRYGSGVRVTTSSFRCFRKSIVKSFPEQVGPTVSIDASLTWATDRIGQIRVSHRPRENGSSSYNFRKLVSMAFAVLTSYTTIPLRIASFLGIVVGLVGFVLLAYVVLAFMSNGSALPGFTFLASAICLLSGAQLLSLGIIGEYLGRAHYVAMRKPTFVVAELTDAEYQSSLRELADD